MEKLNRELDLNWEKITTLLKKVTDRHQRRLGLTSAEGRKRQVRWHRYHHLQKLLQRSCMALENWPGLQPPSLVSAYRRRSENWRWHWQIGAVMSWSADGSRWRSFDAVDSQAWCESGRRFEQWWWGEVWPEEREESCWLRVGGGGDCLEGVCRPRKEVWDYFLHSTNLQSIHTSINPTVYSVMCSVSYPLNS